MYSIMNDIKQLIRFIKIVNKNDGFSVVYLFFNYFYNLIFFGFSIRQYITLGVYKMSNSKKRTYVNYFRAKKLEKWFNNTDEINILNDKRIFNSKFSKYVQRDYLVLDECSENEIKEFLKNHKEVLIKPSGMSSGRGIGLIHDFAQIENYKDSGYLLEDKLQNHYIIKQFSRRSLNTVRIYTLKKKDGTIIFLSATLRIGDNNSIVDNMHGNGHSVPIDIDDGMLIGNGKSYDSTIYTHNPTSGKRYIGITLPYWKDTLECAIYAHQMLKECRYCAWDIAILEDGPELIEGNVEPDPNLMQMHMLQGNFNVFTENR